MVLTTIDHTRFSERMRPHQFMDLVQLPLEIIQRLGEIERSGRCPDMALVGSPGLGKTSTVRKIIKSIEVDALTVSASDLTPKLQDEMLGFTTTAPYFGKKLLVIEDADRLSANLQASLRAVVEDSEHCRFMLTINDIKKMDAPLLSRFWAIPFSVEAAHEPKVLKRLMARYEKVLGEMKVPYNVSRLREIVANNLGDFRQMAIEVETAIVLPYLAAAAQCAPDTSHGQ